ATALTSRSSRSRPSRRLAPNSASATASPPRNDTQAVPLAPHLSPLAGRGRLASGALAERSKAGEGALGQGRPIRYVRTRGGAPSPGFHRSATLRSESDPGSSPGQALSPQAGRGGARGSFRASLKRNTC